MSPTKTNASESSRPRKISTQKPRKAFKQRKIPKTLDGVPVYIYGAKMDDFMNGDATIQPLVVSESAPSSLPHVTTPPRQETVNLARASSYFPQADLVQIPVSTQVYRGAPEPAHVPISGSFQYDPDHLNHDSQADSEDIFSLTNNPCQSYGRYDPSYHLLPPFSSTASSGLEHGVEPYQWLDQNAQYLSILQSYISNASSTFPGNPGNSDNNNDIYAEFRSTAMTSANDGTLPFPNYDANNLHYYTGM